MMPGRAFIPGPLAQAQPRVYRSLRGRQLWGLLLSAAGAGLGLLLFGAQDVTGYGATFLLAVPGFAYGYFHPEGKPVEYWLKVILRFYLAPRQLTGVPQRPWWGIRTEQVRQVAGAIRRMRRLYVDWPKEAQHHG